MLILTRKKSERLVIGDNVVVTIVEVVGGRVRLGIEAPPEIPIRRDEIPRKDTSGVGELRFVQATT
jgi:carbon storage regulator